ncbi:MAG: TadE/TadG family type IV pilus assembly protein [Candidatus Phaeomarinobacter sp.]
MSILKVARSFKKDDRGMSAVEIALLLPVMVVMYLGAVEIAAGLIAHRKATAVASTAADLAAQALALSNADVNDIFGASRAILAPYDATGVQIVLTSASDQGTGSIRVDWSDGYNTAPHATGSTIVVPNNLVFTNGSVIIAEVTYTYTSTMGEYLTGSRIMEDTFYARPRRSLVVARVP